MNFDFRDSSSETVEASEDFDQAYLNIKLKGASKLSDSSEKVKINDREMSYSNSKEYGPYPKTKDITISATGKAKGRTFKSETKTISADDLKDNTKVTLEFESDKISSYVEKKEEENSLKNKLTQFLPAIQQQLIQLSTSMILILFQVITRKTLLFINK